MLEGEAARLLHLQKALEKRVVGQSFAVQAVSEAIQRSRSGLMIHLVPPVSFYL